jgi:uncharacterized protein YjhX (UPF0386 family)
LKKPNFNKWNIVLRHQSPRNGRRILHLTSMGGMIIKEQRSLRIYNDMMCKMLNHHMRYTVNVVELLRRLKYTSSTVGASAEHLRNQCYNSHIPLEGVGYWTRSLMLNEGESEVNEYCEISVFQRVHEKYVLIKLTFHYIIYRLHISITGNNNDNEITLIFGELRPAEVTGFTMEYTTWCSIYNVIKDTAFIGLTLT